jgi:hypothetical protein
MEFDDLEQDFLPRNPEARAAVLKSRAIVKRNNEFIHKIKADSNLSHLIQEEMAQTEVFSYEDSYTFDLYKIKSKIGFREFFKDLMGN